MRSRREGRRGSSVVEFTLVGIPIVFVLISTFEMARGMWLYHTLAFSVREGTRFLIVKGRSCCQQDIDFPEEPDCAATVAGVADRIRRMGIGLDPADLEITLAAGRGTTRVTYSCKLSDCLTNTTLWPPDGFNVPGMHTVAVTASYPFRSAIAMFWPGAGGGMVFPTFRFPASAMEEIQF